MKGQKGITLVALVITVVVMLILAGVAIAAVVDGNGLFNSTRNAANEYQLKAEAENQLLNDLKGYIDNQIQINDYKATQQP